MFSNESIIIDKGELHEDCVKHIFGGIFPGQNSTFNSFFESNVDDQDTGTEVLAGDLIHNATENYKNMVSEK